MRVPTFFAAISLIFFMVSGAEAGAMTFRPAEIGDCRTSCSTVLLGEGTITVNSDRAFLAALRRVKRGTPVLLHSPGGNLAGSLLLGIAFRETGSTVGVAPGGGCYSACAYALIGGVNRRVPAGAEFGVHEFWQPGRKPGARLSARERYENEEIAGLLRSYAQLMGVNPSLIGMAMGTRQDKMRVLSRKELRRMGVVTDR